MDHRENSLSQFITVTDSSDERPHNPAPSSSSTGRIRFIHPRKRTFLNKLEGGNCSTTSSSASSDDALTSKRERFSERTNNKVTCEDYIGRKASEQVHFFLKKRKCSYRFVDAHHSASGLDWNGFNGLDCASNGSGLEAIVFMFVMG